MFVWILDADLSVFSLVDGITPPIRSVHDTVLDVELLSGITMSGSKRLQVNIRPVPISWTQTQPGVTNNKYKQQNTTNKHKLK
jgi:hypothetical protein